VTAQEQQTILAQLEAPFATEEIKWACHAHHS
jgi:hypothetical protein